MSTRASIEYVEDSFHLYEECFDTKNIYLDLENVEYIANVHGTGSNLQICIPTETMVKICESFMKVKDELLSRKEISLEKIEKNVENFLKLRKEKTENK